METECENCWYYNYDEEEDEYYCAMELDEDEMYRIRADRRRRCPFFRQADDYYLPHRQ